MAVAALRPEYMSRRTLATMLDCSESTVDELTRRGVLPKPVRLSGGVVRWQWEGVVRALDSLQGLTCDEPEDLAMLGVRNVAKRIAAEKAAKAVKEKGGR
jgi:predicted DNA-binding transcriptional regulator AlpA